MLRFNQSRIAVVIAVVAMAISACALLGVPPLESFGDRLAAGYVSVTGARTLTRTLLNGQAIGSADAKNVQEQLDVAREGLDVASTLQGLPAQQKLDSALAVMNAALSYLCAKTPTDPNCQQRSQP